MTRAEIAECVRIAASQYGVIARTQAVAAGLSPQSIHRLISEGTWRRTLPGVYVAWTPAVEAELWRHKLKIGELWLGANSAVSHRAAHMVWQLDGVDAAPLEYSTARNLRAPAAGFVVHRVSELAPHHVALEAGFRVTSISRTLIDLAGVVPIRTVELALESAIRKQLTTRNAMRAELASTRPTQPGRAALRALLGANPGVPTESAFETLAWQFFRDWGLPLPVRQLEVFDERGRFVARIDFAYPDARVAIELDGFASHASPAHLSRDRRRQNALVKLGWTVYRITWREFMRRRPVIAEDIRTLLAARLAQESR